MPLFFLVFESVYLYTAYTIRIIVSSCYLLVSKTYNMLFIDCSSTEKVCDIDPSNISTVQTENSNVSQPNYVPKSDNI